MGKMCVVVGATSAIAHATCREMAKSSWDFHLIARNSDKLATVVKDLKAFGAGEVSTHIASLEELGRQTEDQMVQMFENIHDVECILFAAGVLGNHERALEENKYCEGVLQANFNLPLLVINKWANILEHQGRGTLAVISSVAGERGRQSNYIYGACKAGLTAYLEGLRNRLFNKGVHVCTIKPGMVMTPMTSHISPSPLMAQPRLVARQIYSAILKKKNSIYTPGYWCVIMAIIRSIPEGIFKRLKL